MYKSYKISKIKSFLKIFSDPERKPILQIFREMTLLLWINKAIPWHYFTSYLFKKGMPDGKDYLPFKLASKIAPQLNDQRLKEVLDNKLYFDLYFKQFNIRIPETILFNHGRRFASGWEIFDVETIDDFKELLKDSFIRNPSLDSMFVKKIYAGSKGANIYKISPTFIESESLELQAIFNEIMQSEFLFQETIKQHPDLDVLNPSSVNTIRIDTLLNRRGDINVLSGYIRMSLNDNFIDNIGSGGCMVGIDLESGLLKKYGYTSFHRNPTELLTYHPLTLTVFEGFKVPLINEVKELVTEAASLIPGLRIIGWDVAIGEDGPVIIEGNSDYGIRGNDLAYGGYRAHPVFKDVLKEIL